MNSLTQAAKAKVAWSLSNLGWKYSPGEWGHTLDAGLHFLVAHRLSPVICCSHSSSMRGEPNNAHLHLQLHIWVRSPAT